MTDIDDDVIEQLASVRESGAVNMFDRHGVQRVAREFGFTALVNFIDDERAEMYVKALEEMGRRR